MTTESETLRYLLWLHHGHDGLYGDDGEMQCSYCGLDFKNDSIDRISENFSLQRLKAAATAIHQIGAGVCLNIFYNCQDSTDEAPHRCDLQQNHTGKDHHCPCGLWSSC